MAADCFLCARLTEATQAAEERAAKAEALIRKHRAMATGERAALNGLKDDVRSRAVDVLRALHCPPFLVLPHIAPAPRAVEKRDRFALLELE